MARGVSSPRSSTKEALASSLLRGTATAAPAGETCLKEVAAGSPVASASSLTRAQALRLSRRLM